MINPALLIVLLSVLMAWSAYWIELRSYLKRSHYKRIASTPIANESTYTIEWIGSHLDWIALQKEWIALQKE